MELRGPLSYLIELTDKRTVRCHQDHIRPRTVLSEQPATRDGFEEALLDAPTGSNAIEVTVPEQEDPVTPNNVNSPRIPEPERYPTCERHPPNYYGHSGTLTRNTVC